MSAFLRKEARLKKCLRRILPLSLQDLGHYVLLDPAYLRNIPFIKSPLFYETRIAPFIAIHCSWLLWPFYRLLKAFDICFVVNLWDSTGHTTAELDQFFRRLYLKKIDPGKRYVMIRRLTRFSLAIGDLYRDRFWCLIINNLVYDLFLPITIRYRDIVLDSGLSRLKIQLAEDLSYSRPPPKQRHLNQIPKRAGFGQWVNYYALRSECSDYFPLKEGVSADKKMMELLGGKKDKLALLHYKTAIGNATALPTDPATYLPAMDYLLEHGYRLVMAGREKLPEEFGSYPIVNYSGSGIASYKRDIQLFSMASIAITGGSGIAFLADCLAVPLVYLNSWHIPLPMFSKYTVAIPTTLQSLSGQFVKFRDQLAIYLDREEKEEAFPEDEFQARNAAPDEILAAVQEALALKQDCPPLSPLQEQFRQLDPHGLLRFSQMRISELFIQRHQHLL